jgi:hypothetical protein
MAYPMMKMFLSSGRLSGIRFKSAAKGYDRRNDPTSFTTSCVSCRLGTRFWVTRTHAHLARHPGMAPDTRTLQHPGDIS